MSENTNIPVLIVDDDLGVVSFIKKSLEEFSFQFFHATSIADAYQLLKENQFRFAILDIQLSATENGLTIAKHINEEYHIPFIVFSGFSDSITFEMVRKVKPHAYLVKPVNPRQLIIHIQEILSGNTTSDKQPQEDDDMLLIRTVNKLEAIYQPDVIYIASDGNYCTIHTLKKRLHTAKTLKSIGKQLNPIYFQRINRGYIINIHFVDKITEAKLTLSNGHVLPISRRYMNEVKNRFRII